MVTGVSVDPAVTILCRGESCYSNLNMGAGGVSGAHRPITLCDFVVRRREFEECFLRFSPELFLLLFAV